MLVGDPPVLLIRVPQKQMGFPPSGCFSKKYQTLLAREFAIFSSVI
jgi:hypothetical protein